MHAVLSAGDGASPLRFVSRSFFTAVRTPKPSRTRHVMPIQVPETCATDMPHTATIGGVLARRACK